MHLLLAPGSAVVPPLGARSSRPHDCGRGRPRSQGCGRLARSCEGSPYSREASPAEIESSAGKNLTLDFFVPRLGTKKSNVRFFAGELTFSAGEASREYGEPRLEQVQAVQENKLT